MIERLLLRVHRFLAARGALREIPRPDVPGPYLHRGFVLRLFGRQVFIHRVFASDPDGLHCHPWHNVSLVLAGGYWERHHDGTATWRGPGSIVFRTARELHRLELEAGTEGRVWSLFLTGRRRRTWGFMPPIADGPVVVESTSGWRPVFHEPRVGRGVFFPRFEEPSR